MYLFLISERFVDVYVFSGHSKAERGGTEYRHIWFSAEWVRHL